MNPIVFELFPGGRRKAVTISCDDGRTQDRQLVKILNDHGMRGTFHLNSGNLDKEGFLSSKEVGRLYQGHEIAAHSVTHPCLPHLSREGLVEEIFQDRRNLEALAGYPVRGLAYPGADYNDAVVATLPSLGIEYGRTYERRTDFLIPSDLYRWGPSEFFHGDLLETGGKFKNLPPLWAMQHLYVAGHSVDFGEKGSWDRLEEFCALFAGDANFWPATTIEVVDYLAAVRRMKSSADGTILQNPSATSVWATIHGQAVEIAAGQTWRFGQ